MRETLASPTLARQAGRFVWLELDFDKPVNQAFIVGHDVTFTPSLFVLDPADGRATATHFGGMTLRELERFLDQGQRGVSGGARTAADAALTKGDEMLGSGRPAAAAAAYREAVRLAGEARGERERAVRALTWALLTAKSWQACGETAAAEAPAMTRGPAFASVVLSGLSCVGQDAAAHWAKATSRTLEPLAAEAVAAKTALRDDRFQLYQQLMHAAEARGDGAGLARWGGLWLAEIEATTPASDDERSALDIARVDAASLLGTPQRALPALVASERAMPGNYNASLRLAQMETAARRYDDALAACARGLAHVTGPLGRSWLLQTKAEALLGKGDAAAARHALEEALLSARAISARSPRENNIRKVTRAIAALDKRAN